MNVIVAEHALKHGLTEVEIIHAWKNYVRMQQRSAPNEEFMVAVGFTPMGDMVQMVAMVVADGYLVVHAMAPATKKVLRELGLAR